MSITDDQGQLPDAVLVATDAFTGHGLLPISRYDEAHVLDVRRILNGEPVNDNYQQLHRTGAPD